MAKHTQESATVPHYNELLIFINLRAQASESLPSSKKQNTTTKPVASFTAGASDAAPNCVLCKTDRHPLYACPRFKSLSHDEKISTVKLNGVCINCHKPGHFLKQCKCCIVAGPAKNLTILYYILIIHPLRMLLLPTQIVLLFLVSRQTHLMTSLVIPL